MAVGPIILMRRRQLMRRRRALEVNWFGFIILWDTGLGVGRIPRESLDGNGFAFRYVVAS